MSSQSEQFNPSTSTVSYLQRVKANLFACKLSVIELTLILGVCTMMLFNAIAFMITSDVGSHEQIRLAKLQAEQEMMALNQP